MFEIDIPGFGFVRLEHLVSDFTGTLSVDGKLLPGVKEHVNKIAEFLKVYILTADTFGKARAELKGINCEIHILEGKDHDIQKEEYIKKLGAGSVVAFGNGNNDRKCNTHHSADRSYECLYVGERLGKRKSRSKCQNTENNFFHLFTF